MSDETEEANSDDEASDLPGRANPRDYPATALVLLTLMGSSVAWMLYKWMGKKRTSPRNSRKNAEGSTASSVHESGPPPAER